MTVRYLLIMGGTPGSRSAIATTIAVPDDFFHEAHDGFTLISNRRGLVLTPGGPTVIGDLFRGATRIVHGVTSRAQPDTPTGLVAACWGRYVAVWSQPSGEIQVLRDPSGALPCYYRQIAGHMLVATDLELIERATPAPRRLDWSEIARILGAGDLRSPATGLSELRELPAGALLTVGPDRCQVTQIWSPWTFAAGSRDLALEEHATNLRACVDMVVAALGGAYPDALATVSGGLDSSIVTLGLGPAARSLACLTVATTDPSGDERRYARLVAEAVRAGYVERFLDAGDVDLGRSQAAHLPRPLGRPFMQSMAKIIAEAAKDSGATAVFNGSGGDNVFCFLQSATPVTDRLLAQGVRRALSTLHDVAEMSKASYLEVASAALRRSLPRNRAYHWRANARFLSADHAAQSGAYDHPWLHPPSGVRIGTVAHLAMLLRMQNYLDPWRADDRFEVLNPLMSQPVIETCLAIPSWVWCAGGEDRAVARHAFEDLLPGPIRRRSWKGGPDSFIGRLAEDNRAFMRERLIDGELASRNCFDRGAISAVLDEPRPMSASDALRLLALTDAEAWVRTMS